MLMMLSHHAWQALRYVARAKKSKKFAGVPGRELRLYPTRATKDGTFLDDLVAEGLLEIVPGSAPGDREGEPPQFRRLYDLTPVGEHAAEYGEYDKPFVSKLKG